MKRAGTWVLAAVCGALWWSTGVERVQAQGPKIGFVKDERVFQEYSAWRKAQEQWDVEKKAWDEEAMSKKQELDDIELEFERQKLILSEDKKKEREAAINAKRDALDAYTKEIFGPEGTAERKYGQLVQPLLESIHKAIEAVAVQGDYDVIFTLQGIGYIKDSYDVTDQVLKHLEETAE
ncbi:MAG TPA: OmpH family outer membrane protein [Candidatus Deferrimicrobium sp.]|nr:OmpH family outer membrane protein [Candidatus Deferrimicrobium sp.]